MGLLGDSFDDPQTMATLALAGGLMGGRTFGQGLLGGVQGYQTMMAGAQDQKTKKAISDAQIANYQSEIQARSLASIRDQRRQSWAMGDNSGGGSTAPAQPGQIGSGSFGVTPLQPGMNAMPQGAGLGGQGSSPLLRAAQAAGIPADLIRTDMALTDGKNIPEWMFKRGMPDMQVINGFASDKNKMTPGFQPGITTAANGQTTLIMPGADGQPIVSAPQGAVNTTARYAGLDAIIKAAGTTNLRKNSDNTESPVNGLDENTSLEAIIARLSGQSGTAPTAPAGRSPAPANVFPTPAGALPNSATAPGSWQGNNPGKPMIKAQPGESDASSIYNDALVEANQRLKAAKDPNEAYRATQDIAGLQGEMRKANISATGQQISQSPAATPGPIRYGMTNDQVIDNKAKEEAVVGTAKADVQGTQARQAGIDGAMNAFKLVDQALAHPGLSTSVGLSGKIDPRNYIPGTDAKNFDAVAQQLKGNAFLTVYAQLRGGGSITEIESAKGESALARMQQAQSETEYRVALKDYQAVIGQGLKRMGVDPAKMDSATGDTGGKQAPTDFKSAGYADKAAAIRDANNAIMRGASRDAVQKRLQSMGLSLPSGTQGGW